MLLIYCQRLLSITILVSILSGVWLTAACTAPALLPSFPEEQPTAIPTIEETSAAPTDEAPAQVVLKWWTPEFLAPDDESEAGRVLQQQVDLFNRTHPTATLQIELKAPHGRGGILDFLRTAHTAAPAVLPDIVSIDTSDLGAALRDGLLQPLEPWLSDQVRSDLYPFAQQVGLFEGQLYAVQYEADVEHLAIDTTRIAEMPRRWDDVIAASQPYIFAAGGRDGVVNDAFLIQYLGAGGRVHIESRTLVLDKATLLRVFQTYAQARRLNVLSEQVLTFNTVDAVWAAYRNQEAALSHVRATRFLADRALVPQTAFAAIPNLQGRTITISRGWALAIVTDDPERQRLATEFIGSLLQSEVLGPWSVASGRLPTTRSALAHWDNEDPYIGFLHQQLEAAASRPIGAAYLDQARALQVAVFDVISQRQTAEAAVEELLETLEVP